MDSGFFAQWLLMLCISFLCTRKVDYCPVTLSINPSLPDLWDSLDSPAIFTLPLHLFAACLANGRLCLFLYSHEANHSLTILIYQGVKCCTKVCNLRITDCIGNDTIWKLRMQSDIKHGQIHRQDGHWNSTPAETNCDTDLTVTAAVSKLARKQWWYFEFFPLLLSFA